MIDNRLTQPRSAPLSLKVCLECIDELEAELAQINEAPAMPEVENRMIEIMPELEAWKQERQAAETYCLSIVNYATGQLVGVK